jgi:hypothetical protein
VTPKAVISRLTKLEFACSECWDGSYQLKINRQISGLPERVARALSDKLNEVCQHIATNLRKEMDVEQINLFGQEVSCEVGAALVDSGTDVTVGSSGIDHNDPRD